MRATVTVLVRLYAGQLRRCVRGTLRMYWYIICDSLRIVFATVARLALHLRRVLCLHRITVKLAAIAVHNLQPNIAISKFFDADFRIRTFHSPE